MSKLNRRSAGGSLVEFALASPLLFYLFLIGLDLAFVRWQQYQLEAATQALARRLSLSREAGHSQLAALADSWWKRKVGRVPALTLELSPGPEIPREWPSQPKKNLQIIRVKTARPLRPLFSGFDFFGKADVGTLTAYAQGARLYETE